VGEESGVVEVKYLLRRLLVEMLASCGVAAVIGLAATFLPKDEDS